MKIIQYGIPRSGSTLVYQLMKSTLNYPLIKTHDFFPFDKAVCTYRDFRDSVVSIWRVHNTPFQDKKISREEITRVSRYIINHIDILKKYLSFPNKSSVLKYEEFYNNYDVVFQCIENLFSVTISKEKRNELCNRCSVKSNLNISKKYNSFEDFDPSTNIHGFHIYKASINTWKCFVKKSDWDFLNKSLKPYLKEWGY